MDNNIAAQLLLSSDVRIAEAAKRVFTSTAMLPSLPSSSTLSAAIVLRRMSDPKDVRLAIPESGPLPTEDDTIQGKEEENVMVLSSATRAEETLPTSSLLTTADAPPVSHLRIEAASNPKIDEEVMNVSTTAGVKGGTPMQQHKSSRKRVASTADPAFADQHASKVSAKSSLASFADSSSSSNNKKKKKSKANETNVMADMIGTVKKPLRPLSSFHLFSQIEREYIIQTTSNTTNGTVDTDPNKSYLTDVPSRYRAIKLSPDWYAGPGKRQKRKHRKAHGVIGFQELSRLISQRWATLDTTDSETKTFVTAIAARELEEYKLEVKEYKKLLALHSPTTNSSTSTLNDLDDDTCGGNADTNNVRLLSNKVTRVVSETENDELGSRRR
jgi:hypothetical protein